jgi:hypothetical protein
MLKKNFIRRETIDSLISLFEKIVKASPNSFKASSNGCLKHFLEELLLIFPTQSSLAL